MYGNNVCQASGNALNIRLDQIEFTELKYVQSTESISSDAEHFI